MNSKFQQKVSYVKEELASNLIKTCKSIVLLEDKYILFGVTT